MELLEKDNRKKYFRFKKKYLLRIKRILGSNSANYLINKVLHATEDDMVEIEVGEMTDIVEKMIFHTDLCVDDDYFETIAGPYYDKFKPALDNYRAIRGTVLKANSITEQGKIWSLSNKWVKNAALHGDIATLEQNIDKMLTLNEIICLISKKRDLSLAKDIVLDSLRYILDENRIKEIEKQYNDLLKQNPTGLDVIENYLKELQKIILDDWRAGITRIEDYKPGEKFKFIGHSTNAESIKGEFYSRLVSCSLYTEEFTDTYRSGFGFLFEPINIIGADGDDMYVDNYMDSDDNILVSTSIPPIASIGKVIDIMRKNKRAQIDNGEEGNIYSEVIIKGFKPIGIFCFTVGEKALSFNYQSALKLKEQYPHLPLVEIDLSLYKSLEELEPQKKRLIFEVEKSLNPRAQTRDKYYYDLYNLFWEEYLALKKTGKYDEDDIIDLYKLNNYLIGFSLDIKDLFSDKYSIKEIRFALLNNPIFGLNRIQYGAFNAYDLEKLYNELSDYIYDPRMEEAVPGLRELIKLLAVTNLTDEQVLEFREKENITISMVNEALRYNANIKLDNLKNDIGQLRERKAALSLTLQEKERLLKVQKDYHTIIGQESFYTLVNYDYRDAKEKLATAEREQARFAADYEKENLLLGEKQEKQRLLSQHRIKNFFQIRQLALELRLCNANLSRIQAIKGTYDKTVNSTRQEIKFILSTFKSQTGIDFLEYPDVLVDAKDKYNSTEESALEYDISELRAQIDELERQITLLMAESNEIENMEEIKTK